jgi:hypothetical protein
MAQTLPRREFKNTRMSANGPTTPPTAKERREQRLAQELRSNLRRRKGKPLTVSEQLPGESADPPPETHDKRS